MRTFLVILLLSFSVFEILSQNTVSTSLEWRIQYKKLANDSLELIFSCSIPNKWMLSTQFNENLGLEFLIKSPKEKEFKSSAIHSIKGRAFKHKTIINEVTEGEVEFGIRMYIGKFQKKLKLRGTIFYWIVQEQIAIPPLEQKFVINIE